MKSTTSDRINALVALGHKLKLKEEKYESIKARAYVENPWFTPEFIDHAIDGIISSFMDEPSLNEWVSKYDLPTESCKKIGLILAGNIPAVGWNDIQCVFIAGHQALIKYSDKDKVIIPYLIEELLLIAPQFAYQFQTIDRLKDYDAVIATGSNNTARYFESYFGKKPNIIRKNRNGVAILNGSETREEIQLLSKDIFTYFGLGCRNVSKIYVPQGYDFNFLLEILHEKNELANHNKYRNNFDYNIALFLLNRVTYVNNGCIILIEDQRFSSRIASLHYEYYNSEDQLANHIQEHKEEIQCVVSKKKIDNIESFEFGQAQCPTLFHYADGVDTMRCLLEL